MGDIAIDVRKAITGTGTVFEDATLGIEDGRIAEIAAGTPSGAYEETKDMSDAVVMPGLVDAHVHLNYTGEPDDLDIADLSDEYLSLRAAREARKALDAGVTTLADVAARENTTFALRNAIQDGVTPGPQIKACGSMLAISGGRATDGRPSGTTIEVDSPHEARRAARELLMYHGADLIKLAATGALSSPHTGARDPQLTVEEMRAATEEAHDCGRPVHAHCYGERGISNALEAGVDVIVHGQSLTDDHIAKMQSQGAMLAPTLTVFRAGEHTEGTSPIEQFRSEQERPESSGHILEETEPNFKKALEHDVPIVMGTDCGMPYTRFGDNAYDLAYMVDWGMDEEDAIAAGTINAARALNADDEIGTIEPGKRANLLFLEEDPLEDIRALVRMDGEARVMLDGRFVSPS